MTKPQTTNFDKVIQEGFLRWLNGKTYNEIVLRKRLNKILHDSFIAGCKWERKMKCKKKQ